MQRQTAHCVRQASIRPCSVNSTVQIVVLDRIQRFLVVLRIQTAFCVMLANFRPVLVPLPLLLAWTALLASSQMLEVMLFPHVSQCTVVSMYGFALRGFSNLAVSAKYVLQTTIAPMV